MYNVDVDLWTMLVLLSVLMHYSISPFWLLVQFVGICFNISPLYINAVHLVWALLEQWVCKSCFIWIFASTYPNLCLYKQILFFHLDLQGLLASGHVLLLIGSSRIKGKKIFLIINFKAIFPLSVYGVFAFLFFKLLYGKIWCGNFLMRHELAHWDDNWIIGTITWGKIFLYSIFGQALWSLCFCIRLDLASRQIISLYTFLIGFLSVRNNVWWFVADCVICSLFLLS